MAASPSSGDASPSAPRMSFADALCKKTKRAHTVAAPIPPSRLPFAAHTAAPPQPSMEASAGGHMICLPMQYKVKNYLGEELEDYDLVAAHRDCVGPFVPPAPPPPKSRIRTRRRVGQSSPQRQGQSKRRNNSGSCRFCRVAAHVRHGCAPSGGATGRLERRNEINEEREGTIGRPPCFLHPHLRGHFPAGPSPDTLALAGAPPSPPLSSLNPPHLPAPLSDDRDGAPSGVAALLRILIRACMGGFLLVTTRQEIPCLRTT
ncbi:hypothetical protein Taro_013078 [Colocasia esculenta]|uniref:Uncharacterized protein n=1 Tax=Colocasia esculenta TaxID=4460 RepID=A0A843UFF7_COLES|nr:hypothetical protein [Colocasia esculenta]